MFDYRRVLDWRLDLLTTLTRDSWLYLVTAPSLICFHSQLKGRDAPTLLPSLQGANLTHLATRVSVLGKLLLAFARTAIPGSGASGRTIQYNVPEDGLCKARTCVNNENKWMKYDSVAITTQPLEHLRKLHYKVLNCAQCALVFSCIRGQLFIPVPAVYDVVSPAFWVT
jgi:hypothetical protein